VNKYDPISADQSPRDGRREGAATRASPRRSKGRAPIVDSRHAARFGAKYRRGAEGGGYQTGHSAAEEARQSPRCAVEPMLTTGRSTSRPIRKGGTAADAVHETIALAKVARAWLRTLWLAENITNSIPCGLAARSFDRASPPRPRPCASAREASLLTTTARVKVAENFRMLGRFIRAHRLAVGRRAWLDQRTRSPGKAAAALDIDTFPQQGRLEAQLPGKNPPVSPKWPAESSLSQRSRKPARTWLTAMWMLASQLRRGLRGGVGVPFSFAHSFRQRAGLEAVELYRRRFKPHAPDDRPRVAAEALPRCGQNEAEADHLCATRNLWVLDLVAGRPAHFLARRRRSLILTAGRARAGQGHCGRRFFLSPAHRIRVSRGQPSPRQTTVRGTEHPPITFDFAARVGLTG